MEQLPTRLHRHLGVLLLFGVVLVIASQLLRFEALLPVGLTILGGAASVLAMADVRHMLTTRRGFGRLSSHITDAANPISFRLNVALMMILACLWGVVCAFGFREIISI